MKWLSVFCFAALLFFGVKPGSVFAAEGDPGSVCPTPWTAIQHKADENHLLVAALTTEQLTNFTSRYNDLNPKTNLVFSAVYIIRLNEVAEAPAFVFVLVVGDCVYTISPPMGIEGVSKMILPPGEGA